jgi:hypothetical protein
MKLRAGERRNLSIIADYKGVAYEDESQDFVEERECRVTYARGAWFDPIS